MTAAKSRGEPKLNVLNILPIDFKNRNSEGFVMLKFVLTNRQLDFDPIQLIKYAWELTYDDKIIVDKVTGSLPFYTTFRSTQLAQDTT